MYVLLADITESDSNSQPHSQFSKQNFRKIIYLFISLSSLYLLLSLLFWPDLVCAIVACSLTQYSTLEVPFSVSLNSASF